MKILSFFFAFFCLTGTLLWGKTDSFDTLQLLLKPNGNSLTYNYEDLKSGKSTLQFVWANNGDKEVEIEWEIIDLRKMESGHKLQDFFKPLSKILVPPGDTVVVDFNVHDLGEKVKPGTYNGLLNLKSKNRIIYSSQLRVHVSNPEPSMTKKLPRLVVLDQMEKLIINFKDLENGHSKIQVTLKNESDREAAVTGKVEIPNLVCSLGLHPKKELFTLHTGDSKSKSPDPKNSAVSISPLESKTLSFDLAAVPFCQDESDKDSPEGALVWGKYEGKVIFTNTKLTNGQPIELDLMLNVPDARTTDQVVVASLERFFQKVTKISKPLGTYSWGFYLFVLFLTFSYVWGRSKRIFCQKFGLRYQVEIDEIKVTKDADKGHEVALIALMRDRLSECGTPPSSMAPGASMAQDTMNAIGDLIPASQVKGLKSILPSLMRAISYKVGYSVSGTLLVQEPPKDLILTLELKDTITQKIKETKTFRNKSVDDVAEQAAYFIHYHSTRYYQSQKPGWSRFPSFDSFSAYKLGQRYEQIDLVTGEENYHLSAVKAPNNAEVRLRQGALLEKKGFGFGGSLLLALRLYLNLHRSWPNFLEAQYRLAVTLSFEKLSRDWEAFLNLPQAQDPEEEKKAKEKMQDLLSLLSVSNDGIINREFFLNLSCSLLKKLEKELTLKKVTWNYILCWLPWCQPYKTERRYWFYFFISPIARTNFLRMVQAGQYTIELQLLSMSPLVIEKDEKFDKLNSKVQNLVSKNIWNNMRNNWNVRYNAMCFYSIALGMDFLEEDQKKYCINISVELLKAILNDPSSKLRQDWFETDPDLLNLHQLPAFRSMLRTQKYIYQKKEPEKNPELQQVQILCQSWDYLASGAKNRAQFWKERIQEIKQWRNIHFVQINKWVQDEQGIWNSLYDWSISPDSIPLRDEFWEKLKGDSAATLSIPEHIRECRFEDLLAHMTAWHQLAQCASDLEPIWQQRVRDIDATFPIAPPTKFMAEFFEKFQTFDEKTTLTPNEMKAWAEDAYRLWQSLATMAIRPLKAEYISKFQENCSRAAS